jgi:hypothetical protein
MKTKNRLAIYGLLLLAPITLNYCTKEEEEAEPNSIPAISAVEEIIGMTSATINISATASDPDSDPLSFTWIIEESPASSSATISGIDNNASFSTTVAGFYRVKITADDGNEGTASAIVKLYIGGVLPTSITTNTSYPDLFEDEKYPDYYATNSIQATAGLTFAPGVVVESGSDVVLWFNGNASYINAEGTTAKNIIFRGIDKVKGSWRLIEINSTNLNNKLNYVQIMHTGSTAASNQKTAILVKSNVSGRLSIKNTSISLSDGYAIYIDGNTGYFSEFSNNNFSDNTLAPMRIGAEALLSIDKTSVYAGNGIPAIEVASAGNTNVRFDNDGTIKNAGVPYHFLSNAELRSVITFEAGVTCLFNAGLRLWVPSDGAIIADGTATDNITFSGLSQAQGAWSGIELASPSTSNLINYGVVSYGGDAAGRGGNIYMFGSTPGSKLTLTNSTISHSQTYGIQRAAGDTQLTEAGNSYIGNATGDVFQN